MYTLTVGLAATQMNFAEPRARLPDGAGGVRRAADPDRLHRLPEVDRPRGGGDGGMRTAASVLAAWPLHAAGGLRPAQATRTRSSSSASSAPAAAEYGARPTSRTRRRMRDHHHDDQPLRSRESGHPGDESTPSPGPATTSSPRSSPPATRPTWSRCTSRRSPTIKRAACSSRSRPTWRRSGVDAGELHRPRRAGVTHRRPHLGPAVRHLGAAVAHQHELFRAGGPGPQRQADPAASPEELLAQARAVQAGAPASPISSRALANEYAAYARNFYTFLMQQERTFFADPRACRLAHARGAARARAVRDDLRRRT